MIVFVAYERGFPQGMKVFRTRQTAQRYILTRLWPMDYVIRKRTVTK